MWWKRKPAPKAGPIYPKAALYETELSRLANKRADHWQQRTMDARAVHGSVRHLMLNPNARDVVLYERHERVTRCGERVGQVMPTESEAKEVFCGPCVDSLIGNATGLNKKVKTETQTQEV